MITHITLITIKVTQDNYSRFKCAKLNNACYALYTVKLFKLYLDLIWFKHNYFMDIFEYGFNHKQLVCINIPYVLKCIIVKLQKYPNVLSLPAQFSSIFQFYEVSGKYQWW